MEDIDEIIGELETKRTVSPVITNKDIELVKFWNAPAKNGAKLLTMPNIPTPLQGPGCQPRTIFGTSTWNKIRKKCYADADYHCEACGKDCHDSTLHAHEVYNTNYKDHTVTFIRVVALCPLCVDGDTEVLTTDGWKKIPDVTTNDMVANYNKDNGEIFFANPTATVTTHPDKAVKIYGHETELFFSPEHRLPLRVASKQSPSYGRIIDVLAKDYKPSHYYNWINNGSNPKEETLSPEERVYIAIEADGHIAYDKEKPRGNIRQRDYSDRYGTKDYRYTYTIHLSKTRKINRLKELLEKSDLKYSITKETSDSYCDFNIWSNKDLKHFANCFDIDMGSEKALEFIEELVFWDGTYSGPTTTWYTNKPEEADFVQAVATQCNVMATINVVNRIGNLRKGEWKTPYERLTYSVNFQSIHNEWSAKTMQRENINWDKPMYCLSVPSTYFVARRNNRVFVTGNCHLGGIHTGRNLTLYKKGVPYVTKQSMLTGAENAFTIISAYNKTHKRKLKAFSTFVDYSRQPELHDDMERLIKKYDMEFYRINEKSWCGKNWNKWKLIIDGVEYPTPYETREDWEKAMEKNNDNNRISNSKLSFSEELNKIIDEMENKH